MPFNWKVLAAFTGIFIAGAVTGGFVGVPLSKHFVAKPITTEQFGPSQMKKMADQLDLTPEQRDKLKPIFKQAGDNLRNTRREAFKATTAIFEQMEASVALELTDEQRVRFAAIQAEERERRKQWMAERAKQRGDNRPPPGPGGGDAATQGPPLVPATSPASASPGSPPAPAPAPVPSTP